MEVGSRGWGGGRDVGLRSRWGAVLGGVWHLLGRTGRGSAGDNGGVPPRWQAGQWWQGLAGRSPQMMEIEEEVAAERRRAFGIGQPQRGNSGVSYWRGYASRLLCP